MAVIITKVKSCLFRDKITIQALDDDEAALGSLLGDRTFFIKKGERVTTKARKDRFVIGDKVPFDRVIGPNNAWDFDWRWTY